jgi:hypothetical protein
MRKLILLLTAVATLFENTSAISNPVGNWVTIGKTAGRDYVYHGGSLIKSDMPPTMVSAKMYYIEDGKANAWYEHEFNCTNETVKIPQLNQAISVKSETNSIRKMWLKGFCGIRQPDGHWFLVGSIQKVGANGEFSGWLFLDAASLRKTNSPFSNGLSFRLSYGSLDLTRKINIDHSLALYDVHIDCKNTEKFYLNLSSNPSAVLDVWKISENDFTGTLSRLACNYFPISTVQRPQPENAEEKNSVSETLENAKSKCTDLGYDPGTEKHGQCVLKLSR